MKKRILILALLFSLQAQAQLPIFEIIKKGITKVIVAVDLKVQRLQNKVIWLQNAQKEMENVMSKMHLEQISDWAEKQRKLYADYFDELRRVKQVISGYQRVKDIIRQQGQIISEYKGAWALFRRDKNFTSEELDYMLSIYTGIMEESSRGLDQLFLVVRAYVTKMSDAKRLEIVNEVAAHMENTLMDLKDFNEENKMISLQRATEKNEIEYVKRLYGIK
ncbi:MAG: conjugal transfer protein TraI [Sphingobacteriales bacterium]|nr:conjugal transfer protein TraI [Sphingobacteriales bacterium]